jgi:PAS domain S-box-containing protein
MNVCNIENNISIGNLIKNIPGAFCIYSTNAEYIKFAVWNKYMIEITGYTMEEINIIGWNNILCNTHSIRNLIDSIDIYECKDKEKEYEIISKNGVRKLISMSTSVIITEDGEENTLALVKDITRYKQVEQELIELEDRYEKILELSTDSIIIHNDEKYLYVNNNTFKMFGIENPEDIIGQPIYKYVEASFHAIVKNRVTIKLATEGRVPIIEEKMLTAKGEVIDVEIASSYVLYKGKKCTFTFIRNITPRKKLENQLRKSESMLRQMTENTLDMITISDANGTIKYGTPSNKTTLGYELENFIGMNVLDLVHPDDLSYIKSMMREMGKTFQEKTLQCFLRCNDGSYKCLEIRAKALNNGRLIEEFIFSSRDISDRKKAEELEKDMKEKSKLLNEAAEYETLRTEFFANISHELKTPVNVILSSLQLLNLKINKNDKIYLYQEEYKRYSAVMKQNCYRLVRLINNLIDVTKIDSGYLNLNLINTNIVNVVEDITQSVVDYTGNKGISLIFDTEVEEKILACDPDKIDRIILNLISNAVKFTEPGGSIFVSLIDKGDDFLISVKDTGIGISKDKQKIIFDRFIQVDKSLARNREGSGIGLSLVKSLVEMHKGTITVNSDLNKGSEFIVKLPIYLVQEENNSVYSNNYRIQENFEKINIEFSDIYY